MKEKKFYSLMNENGVIGVKKHNGYQIESDDVTLYAYEEYSLHTFPDVEDIEVVGNIYDNPELLEDKA